MKRKFYSKALFMAIGLCISFALSAQVLITSTPDSSAVLNESYSYDVEAVTLPPGAPVTYTLLEKPTGMTINSSTGVISWIPTSVFHGGKVVVKATKSITETSTQSFYVYVTDAIACPAGLTSYWNFDSKLGNQLPEAINSYNGDYVGVETNEPLMVNGKVDKAYSFNPQSDASAYYEVADQDQYDWKWNDQFSISLWFKNKPSVLNPKGPETLVGRAFTEGHYSSWVFQWLPASSMLGFYIQSSNDADTIALASTNVNDTLWHHAVLVFVGSMHGPSRISLYTDNSPRTTFKQFGPDTAVITNFTNITPLTIGHWDQYGDKMPFSGLIDEVAIFDTALTNPQVAQLFNKGNAGQPVCQDGNFTPIITTTPGTAATEDGVYSYTLKARDYELTPLTKSVVAKPDWLTFNASTGVLSGTPDNEDVGNHNVTLRVSDGQAFVDQTFTINVSNVNDTPEVTSTAVTAVDEDQLYTYTFVAEDIDASDDLTLTAPELPSWLSFNEATGLLSGTPTNAQVGTSAFATFDVTLRATDESNAYAEQEFTITVTNINDAPVISGDNSVSTDEDVSVEITKSALNVTDVDDVYPGDFTLTVKSGQNYTFNGNTITPAADWNGTLVVPVDLSDGQATVSYNLPVEVVPVDDEPEFTSDPVLIITAGSNYQYWVICEDKEDQELTISASGLPSWLNLAANGSNALLSGVPTNADAGVVDITLKVTDGTTEVEQPYQLTVNFNTDVKDHQVDFATVYPVPASEFVNFTFSGKLENASLEVFSSNGLLIKKINISGLSTYQLDIKDLEPSQYIYRLTNGNTVQNGYLIVQ